MCTALIVRLFPLLCFFLVSNACAPAISLSICEILHPDEEHEKDYDMRGLTKLERQSIKSSRGSASVSLRPWRRMFPDRAFTDTSDSRFPALLDGNDDRFGIDRTKPAYKETGAMKELLYEQSMRRNKNLGDPIVTMGMGGNTVREKRRQRMSVVATAGG
jgi:hypothetical protein